MIVLLHAYHLGFTAWQTAVMFTLYEVAGVVTNLLAGLMGARWGIKATLLTGAAGWVDFTLYYIIL
jgi:MFS family permease